MSSPALYANNAGVSGGINGILSGRCSAMTTFQLGNTAEEAAAIGADLNAIMNTDVTTQEQANVLTQIVSGFYSGIELNDTTGTDYGTPNGIIKAIFDAVKSSITVSTYSYNGALGGALYAQLVGRGQNLNMGGTFAASLITSIVNTAKAIAFEVNSVIGGSPTEEQGQVIGRIVAGYFSGLVPSDATSADYLTAANEINAIYTGLTISSVYPYNAGVGGSAKGLMAARAQNGSTSEITALITQLALVGSDVNVAVGTDATTNVQGELLAEVVAAYYSQNGEANTPSADAVKIKAIYDANQTNLVLPVS